MAVYDMLCGMACRLSSSPPAGDAFAAIDEVKPAHQVIAWKRFRRPRAVAASASASGR